MQSKTETISMQSKRRNARYLSINTNVIKLEYTKNMFVFFFQALGFKERRPIRGVYFSKNQYFCTNPKNGPAQESRHAL